MVVLRQRRRCTRMRRRPLCAYPEWGCRACWALVTRLPAKGKGAVMPAHRQLTARARTCRRLSIHHSGWPGGCGMVLAWRRVVGVS